MVGYGALIHAFNLAIPLPSSLALISNKHRRYQINYLNRYDEIKRFLDNKFKMPDKMVAMLVRFLEQNKGQLSQRAKTKEFSTLQEDEIKEIETKFQNIVMQDNG